jgi:hypothetical protein
VKKEETREADATVLIDHIVPGDPPLALVKHFNADDVAVHRAVHVPAAEGGDVSHNGSTCLPGVQQAHRRGDVCRCAGSAVGTQVRVMVAHRRRALEVSRAKNIERGFRLVERRRKWVLGERSRGARRVHQGLESGIRSRGGENWEE